MNTTKQPAPPVSSLQSPDSAPQPPASNLQPPDSALASPPRSYRGQPDGWHQAPNPDEPTCSVCGLASECFKTRWRNRVHRARREGDPPQAHWFLKLRANSIHALDAAGKRLPASLLATEPMRDRLHQAAGRIAFGVPVATVARMLGIKPDTLYRSMVKYSDVFKEEMKRAGAALPRHRPTGIRVARNKSVR